MSDRPTVRWRMVVTDVDSDGYFEMPEDGTVVAETPGDWSIPAARRPRTVTYIAAAEQETPLQRASREVTEQQDAAAEQDQP